MLDHTHIFGGEQTRIKLGAISKYLPAYTTALSNTQFRLSYIDAFAGTGVCHVKIGKGQEKRLIPGSASIAIDCKPPFHQIFFIEKKKRHADALRRLKIEAAMPVEVIHGDANSELPPILRGLNPKKDRALVFLDPYGMAVDWITLKAIADSQIVDLWYLFPLSGLYRQAANDAAAIDPDKAAALDRMLGTETWRKDFYAPPKQTSLFESDESDVRTADVKQMTKWVTTRLKEIFPGVTEPRLLYQALPNGKEGAPLFALYFAASNPSPKAHGLACKIAADILKRT